MPPSWVNPEWQDDDIFKLSSPELLNLKTKVAAVMKTVRYQNQNSTAEFAHETCGLEVFSETFAKERVEAFLTLRDNPPVQANGTSDEDFAAQVAAHAAQIHKVSKVSMVISGLMVSWECPNGIWNEGYIAKWWQKFADGEATWDTSIERKAGGIEIAMGMDYTKVNNFVVANASSVMALIRAVAGHVMRTGECPEHLVQAFASIRITWLLMSTKDEMVNLSSAENIEQHLRRRHTEFDNLFQVRSWIEGMQRVHGVSLDPKKSIDIVKYALAMGDPTQPHVVPHWLQPMLKGHAPTLKNKLVAITSTKGVNKKFLDEHRIQINHPEVKTYNKALLRIHAVQGFTAWELLHKLVVQEMGRRGFGHKQCPLSSSLLLDPAILNKDGMSSKSEKDNVPQWRDGEAGVQLHKAMAEVARAKLFDHGMVDTAYGNKALFASGTAWVSFARLNGPPNYHMDAVLERNFEGQANWNDGVKFLHRNIWIGEHDQEIVRLSSLLPSTMDSQPLQMQKRLGEMFTPLLHLIQARTTEAQQLQTDRKLKEEAAKKKKEEEEAKAIAAKQHDVSGVIGVHEDGDITDDVGQNMDPSQKKTLVNNLNKAATKKREQDLETSFLRAAADVLRHRLIVVESTAAAKLYMESSIHAGYKARVQYIDFTQLSKLQTRDEWAKKLCTNPDKALSQALAASVKNLPMTSIIGTALIRTGGASIEWFSEALQNNMPYPRTLFVPIDLPPQSKKHLLSAQRRALGPLADDMERSGVEFTMRTIGVRQTDQDAATKDDEDEADAESEGLDMDVDDEKPEEDTAGADVGSLESMTRSQLKGAFGREALAVLGAMFQHQSKICAQARFLEKKDYVYQVKESGQRTLLRKSQVHPTVIFEALKSVIATSSAGLNPTDCFIQVCGGTPEPCVAAIMMGFQKAIYVANATEMEWMRLATKEEETLHKIDYVNYSSPDLEQPSRGFLAAAAVRMLAPYVRNAVMETSGSIMVPPPYIINVPPVQQYAFIPVTGRIVARTINAANPSFASPAGKRKATTEGSPAASSSSAGGIASAGGPGSQTGAKEPKTPQAKGKILSPKHEDEEQDEGEDDGEDDAEETEGGALENELAQLEAMEAQEKPPKGGKSPKAAPKGGAKGPKEGGKGPKAVPKKKLKPS